MRDDTLQRRLLAVAKLSYEKAYELAVLHESAAQNSRLLSTSHATPVAVHYCASSTNLSPEDAQPRQCYRCGGNHAAKTCRFKDVVCNFCSKKGHIQRVCQSRLRQRQSRSPPARSALGKQPYTHKVEEGTEPPASAGVNHPPATQESPPQEPLPVDYNVFGVGTDKKAHPPATQESPPQEPLPVDYSVFGVGTDKEADPYLVTVTVEGATLQMEIDTGSALTLISQATFSKLWPEGQSPRLEGTTVRLKTYSGEELEVLGRVVVRVRCGGQVVEDLGLVVVGGGGPSLLGRDWFGRLRLDWREVRKLPATSDKLDLAHAYQQLILDADSRPYTTINTHKGLFQHTRLPWEWPDRPWARLHIDYAGPNQRQNGFSRC